jgi:uncharacterized protein YjdB
MGTIMNRRLLGMLTTALAFCITLSCSDRSTSDPTGLALNDPTGDASRVVSATVTLAQASLQVGQTTQATALLLDSRNRILNQPVAWSTSSTTVATVSASGLVMGMSSGTVDIIATRGSKSGSATLTVTPSTAATASVASVSVALPKSSLSVGQTIQATDTLRDSSNNVLTGRAVIWTSSNVTAATVSDSGMVTARGAGTTQITASSDGATGTAALSVTTATVVPVATVSVSPASSSILVGATVQLSATTRDSSNNVLTGRVVTWSSANAGIASVGSNGLVSAVSAGTIQVTATSEGKSGSATITVAAIPPPPLPGNSNEPSGMTFIDQRPFNTLQENAAPHVPYWDTDNSLSIVQDTTAPRSPSNVIRATFPTGYTGGSAPGHAGTPFGNYRTLYVSWWGKYSANWWGHLTGVNKQAYFGANGGPGQVYFEGGGVGSANLGPRIVLQAGLGTDFSDAPNLVPGAVIPRGAWFQIEVVLVGNTGGNSDGTIDWWLNGVHVGSRTGLKMATTAAYWDVFEFRPIWGGLGDTVPATQTLDWDHVYLSGKN